MENLIKPVDYAAKVGISRQAVYAKIKKGILPSRNIGGKIFIVMDENSEVQETIGATTSNSTTNSRPKSRVSSTQNHEALLKAKDETISILKDTVTDLKETNKMITSTMRGEVELLKEAFGEMKMLYRVQIEHQKEAQTIDIDHIIEEPIDDEPAIKEDDIEIETIMKVEENREEWVALRSYLEMHDIQKSKKQKKIKSLLKDLIKDGDNRVEKRSGEILFIADRDIKKRLKRAIV